MQFHRRGILELAAGAAAIPIAMPAILRTARADTYPSHPVHLIVPQAAASSTDIQARLIGQWLQDHLGQPFVVDDKPGAGGNVGTEFVVHATPDGYTLLTVNSQNSISPALYPDLGFNFLKDIAPVSLISLTALIMEVTPSLPVTTVPEFIAYAKANPGKINMASAGVGGPQHLAGELSHIMQFVEQLAEVKTDGVAPMTSVAHMTLPRRPDVVTDGDYSEKILANAPDAMDGFFLVPKVVE